MNELYESRPSTYAVRWRIREMLLKSEDWLRYVRQIYAMDQGDYPFFTYVGINFNAASIKNYKFYFSFYRRLSPSEIAAVLPVENRSRFDEFYANWHPTKEAKTLHRGVTFAVKVEPDGALTHYYHLRVPGLPFGPPERLTLAESDRGNFHGVCEEFTGSKVHLKRYFYCQDPATIAESLSLCGMPDRTSEVSFLEYIESEGRDKLTWVSHDQLLIQALVLGRGQPQFAAVLSRLCQDCDSTLYAPGTARDGTDQAIYFYPHAMLNRYDGVRIFAEQYLKLAIK